MMSGMGWNVPQHGSPSHYPDVIRVALDFRIDISLNANEND